MKSQIKILQLLLILESFMNIHRNYMFLPSTKRVLVAMCIFLEIFVSIAVFGYWASTYTGKYNQILFYVLSGFSFLLMLHGYLMILIFGPKSSRPLTRVLQYLYQTHDSVGSDVEFKKSMNNLKLRCSVSVTIFFIVRISTLYLTTGLNPRNTSNLNIRISSFAFTILKFFFECRYALEMLVFYVFLSLFSDMLSYLTFLVNTRNCDNKIEIATEELEKYSKIYHNLFECSKKLMVCFGHQMACTLGFSIAHFIVLVFNITKSFLIYGTNLWVYMPSMFSLIAFYSLSALAVARVGQRVQRDTHNLRVYLSRLCIHASKHPETPYYKTVRDFQRVVCVSPIALRLLRAAARPVGMHMVPAALSLTITYIIVIFQLDNDF